MSEFDGISAASKSAEYRGKVVKNSKISLTDIQRLYVLQSAR
jgi:hypothetical protein